MPAKTLMIQGTASSVGKSLMVAGLCRVFKNMGLKVAPFKSQNMALNSAVTLDGKEIGRAQATQAEAAGVTATVSMNPILLKPEGNYQSQIIVKGKSVGSMSYDDYRSYKKELQPVISDCLNELRAENDIVVIEGAGSPAEINLRDHDIVNMFVAEMADAPVLLVGDIDRGGVFASFVGTIELLREAERRRVKGFIINKFRGNAKLLDSGLSFLQDRTGIPTLGIVPYVSQLRIAEEDSLGLDDRTHVKSNGIIDIAIVRYPRISNYDDFDPLEHTLGVDVRYVESSGDIAEADLVILPGSKSTIADMQWLQASGIADVLKERHRLGQPILGICGGCQILSKHIVDEFATESKLKSVEALGMLDATVQFGTSKVTNNVTARLYENSDVFHSDTITSTVSGYEIHMGMLKRNSGCKPMFVVDRAAGAIESDHDGAVAENGTTVGTMLHGLFENESIRQSLIKTLKARKGLDSSMPLESLVSRDAEYDRLAKSLTESLDMKQIRQISGL